LNFWFGYETVAYLLARTINEARTTTKANYLLVRTPTKARILFVGENTNKGVGVLAATIAVESPHHALRVGGLGTESVCAAHIHHLHVKEYTCKQKEDQQHHQKIKYVKAVYFGMHFLHDG
jgi:hypothetical protein